ncbi:MAG: YncE family protein, partial [Patescibacteria group bacterium]
MKKSLPFIAVFVLILFGIFSNLVSADTVLVTIPVGGGPRAFATVGSKVFVANFDDATVSVIDTANANSVSTVNVGAAPQSMVSVGSKVYVVNSGDNSVSV